MNDWFVVNNFTLNLNKTNYVLYKSHRKAPPKEKFGMTIQDAPLIQVESARFFGRGTY